MVLGGISAAVLIVNGAIKGGFVAIARQPLSKKFIMREVLQSFGIALVIVVVVSVGALALLRTL